MLFKFEWSLTGRKQEQFCNPVDGIYPKWAMLLSTIPYEIYKKERLFEVSQEALTKDVEHGFSVLVSGCYILRYFCNFRTKDWKKKKKIMKGATILQSRIKKAGFGRYQSELSALAGSATDWGWFIDESGEEKCFTRKTRWFLSEVVGYSISSTGWASPVLCRDNDVMDEVVHHSLMVGLIGHLWNCWGLH